MDKCQNSVENGKKDGEDDSEGEHKKMVYDEFDVLVREVHRFVVDSNCPSALMLVKAFLEVKLQ